MIIKIDGREQLLHKACSNIADINNIKIITEALPIGDVIICNEDMKELVIFERKTVGDLASSIVDGRYKEQGFRLNLHPVNNHNIYYVIEGDMKTYRPFGSQPPKKTLISALVSISYIKGFSVYRTFTIDETAEFIMQFANKMHKDGGNISANISAEVQSENGQAKEEEHSSQEYASLVKGILKKDNITPKNIDVIMLSQIPGVSSISANAILNKFGDITNTINSLKDDVNGLNDVKVANKNGQLRKLNTGCIANIYKFLIKTDS